MRYTIRPLDASTWAAFAELVERNNGVFGGCWCIGYHPERGQKEISHRAVKEDRVRTDRAHAALVIDADGFAQGWCQYGSPAELPSIKHKREHDTERDRRGPGTTHRWWRYATPKTLRGRHLCSRAVRGMLSPPG
jgi:hypothetical protein